MDSPNTTVTPRGTIIDLPLARPLEPTTQEHINAVTSTPVNFSDTELGPVYTAYFATVLDNVFTEDECAILRALPEDHWSSLTQGDAFRKVDRALVFNAQVAETLYMRILPHLEQAQVVQLRKKRVVPAGAASAGHIRETEPEERWSAEDIAGANSLKAGQGRHKATWTAYGANERLSFLRYSPGMHHDRHCDQVFHRAGVKDDKSFLTCQVYLSDAGEQVGGTSPSSSAADAKHEHAPVTAGGTTRFWGPPGTKYADKYVDVTPKAGRVLVFQQRLLWHSGQPVTAGQKFAMRTDLMYKRTFT